MVCVIVCDMFNVFVCGAVWCVCLCVIVVFVFRVCVCALVVNIV